MAWQGQDQNDRTVCRSDQSQVSSISANCLHKGYRAIRQEYRNWVELPQSGPPPARYYLPTLHRYISQELAYQLWLKDRWFADCACPECDGEPPIALDYHALMRHSVFCRELEIIDWSTLAAGMMVDRLRDEANEFHRRLYRSDVSEYVERQAQRSASHLADWHAALQEIT